MRTWSMALCPSGKVLEIKEGDVGPIEMLPPCNSADLPEWVRIVEHKAYLSLQARYAALKEENANLKSLLSTLPKPRKGDWK